ncbi:MAG: carbon storage regulator [Planctomycetota bacterium]
MLALTVEPGGRVYLGSDTYIEALRTDAGQVRLGFHAPPGTVILREAVAARLVRSLPDPEDPKQVLARDLARRGLLRVSDEPAPEDGAAAT